MGGFAVLWLVIPALVAISARRGKERAVHSAVLAVTVVWAAAIAALFASSPSPLNGLLLLMAAAETALIAFGAWLGWLAGGARRVATPARDQDGDAT